MVPDDLDQGHVTGTRSPDDQASGNVIRATIRTNSAGGGVSHVLDALSVGGTSLLTCGNATRRLAQHLDSLTLATAGRSATKLELRPELLRGIHHDLWFAEVARSGRRSATTYRSSCRLLRQPAIGASQPEPDLR